MRGAPPARTTARGVPPADRECYCVVIGRYFWWSYFDRARIATGACLMMARSSVQPAHSAATPSNDSGLGQWTISIPCCPLCQRSNESIAVTVSSTCVPCASLETKASQQKSKVALFERQSCSLRLRGKGRGIRSRSRCSIQVDWCKPSDAAARPAGADQDRLLSPRRLLESSELSRGIGIDIGDSNPRATRQPRDRSEVRWSNRASMLVEVIGCFGVGWSDCIFAQANLGGLVLVHRVVPTSTVYTMLFLGWLRVHCSIRYAKARRCCGMIPRRRRCDQELGRDSIRSRLPQLGGFVFRRWFIVGFGDA